MKQIFTGELERTLPNKLFNPQLALTALLYRLYAKVASVKIEKVVVLENTSVIFEIEPVVKKVKFLLDIPTFLSYTLYIAQ